MIGARLRRRPQAPLKWRRRFTRHIAAIIGVITLTTTGKPIPVLADLAAWKPVFAKFGSRLTLQSTYATNESTSNQGLNNTTTRQGFRESLSLGTIGYVYHPDLMYFDMSGTYGEDQTKIYEAESSRSSRGGYDAYDLSALFLRKKPYTLELSTTQDKPFTSSATGDDTDVTQETAAEFNYKKRVYNAKLQYTNTKHSSGSRLDTTNNYEAFGDFQKPQLGWLENFMTNANARYQEDTNQTSNRNGQKLTTQNANVSNRFGYKIFDFSTNINNSTTTIRDDNIDGGQGAADLFSINEGVTAELPWNFTSTAWLSKTANNDQNRQGTANHESSMVTDQLQFTLVQRLYESLITQLSTNLDSTQSEMIEGVSGSGGEPIELAPVKGSNEQGSYILESRYTKKLPFQSTLTGRMSTRNTQITRTGLTSDAKVYSSVNDNGGTIDLPSNTDTATTITIDVLTVNLLKNPNDICKEAVTNPRAISSSCWLPLQDANDFSIESAPIPKITINTINDNPDFATIYEDTTNGFNNGNGTYGPFTFRVTLYLKAADLTSQTNLAAVGLNLSEIVSSRYQHSVTTQDGTYGGDTLQHQVTEDTITLGVTLESVTAEISRQWITTSGLETINEGRIFYTKSKKFFQHLTVDLSAEAHSGAADITNQPADVAQQSSEDGYSYSLSGGMLIPYINAAVKVSNGYSSTRGAIDRLALNSEGVNVKTQDFGIGRRSILRNSVEFTKPFKIPWVEFVINSYARYRWETTTDDYDRERLTLQYGVTAARGWRFGATSVNLRANYAISNDIYDTGGDATYVELPTLLQREEETNNTSVVLTIARQLF
jgi:hypothetical protein